PSLGAPHADVHCVDRAVELHERAIAGDLKYAPLMFGYQRLQHLLAPRLEHGKGSDLVGLHQPAVADHVGGQDGSKATLGAFRSHQICLLSENPQVELYCWLFCESISAHDRYGSRAAVNGLPLLSRPAYVNSAGLPDADIHGFWQRIAPCPAKHRGPVGTLRLADLL